MPHYPVVISMILVVSSIAAISSTSATAEEKGTLVMGWELPPRSFDPRFSVEKASRDLESLVDCSLLTLDSSGKLVGDLAEKWTWTSNKSLKIVLRGGATFSDGAPVSAADVKETYDFFKRKDVLPASPRVEAFADVQDIQAPDANTVVFTLTRPDASFVSNLIVGILPAASARGPTLTSDKPRIGCGPFVLTSVEAKAVSLRKSSKYSLGPHPKLEKLEIKFIKDEALRLDKLKRGQIDIALDVANRSKVAELAKTSPHLQVMHRLGTGTTYIGFNTRDHILKSPAVRRAIWLAINREAIIKHLLNGFATPATTFLRPENIFYEKTLDPLPYNPRSAAKLLDEAGLRVKHEGGSHRRFSLTYKTTTNDVRIQVAKAVAAMLSEIGIQVIVQAMEWEKLKQDIDRGSIQMWGLTREGVTDPNVYREAFSSERMPPNGGNYGRYANTDLDRLLSLGSSIADETARRQIYSKVQLHVQQDVPAAFLWHEDIIAVANNSVKNFQLYPDGRLNSLSVVWKE